MKIVGLVPRLSAVTEYRIVRPLKKIGGKTIRCFKSGFGTLLRKNEKATPDELAKRFKRKADVWVVKYLEDLNTANLLVWMRNKEKFKLVVDIDDNVWEIPYGNITIHGKEAMDAHIKRGFWTMELMKAADAVTVSTEPLKEKLKTFNSRIEVIPNLIDPKDWHFKRKKHDKVRIGWIYSHTHIPDVKEIQYAWDEIQKKYGDKVEMIIFGSDLKLFKKDPIHFWGVKFKDYPKKLAELALDISICPLEDNEFNKCKCVVAGTKVITDKGILPIERILIGNKVVLKDANKKVVETYKYQNRRTIKIITESGYEIEGTENHKIEDNSGSWLRFSDVNDGDEIKISKFDILQKEYQSIKYPLLLTKSVRQDVFDNSDEDMLPRIVINEKWGVLLGLLFGDGYMHGFNRVGISCSTDYPDIIELCETLFHGIGIRTLQVKKKNTHKEGSPETKEGKAVDVIANSRNLRNLFEYCGFTGVKGKVFKIPEIILKSPKTVIANFLSGLFEADGCVSGNGVNFITKSKELASDVQIVLLGFGIKSKLFARRNRKYDKDYYTISLGREGAEIFEKTIGFLSETKKRKLKMITTRKHSNAFKKFDWNDKVVKMEYGTGDVYDIEVEDKHYYLANGFISHNSNIKWLESSMSGAAVVASNVTPYENSIEHGITGFLAREESDWVKYISLLVENKDLREKMAKAAKEEILEKYNIEKDNKIAEFYKNL